jgi:hypothetical protein
LPTPLQRSASLDLVIGVDTAVMHVAGGLAKPVWMLLPDPADWRWLENCHDSAWYPTMRLFPPARSQRLGRRDTARDRRGRSTSSRKIARRVPWIVLATRIASSPPLMPVAALGAKLVDGMSRVAETRMGLVQHFPDRSEASESIAMYGEYLQPSARLRWRRSSSRHDGD